LTVDTGELDIDQVHTSVAELIATQNF
jgi:hypothetical protein